jgi:hypothetical protein
MLSITLILLVAALLITIASSLGKAPLWIAVILVIIVQLLLVLPIK